jgi:translation initiation factor 2 alpha subunit (eIF-2alpha)
MYYNLKDNLPPLDSYCFVTLADYNIKSTDLGVYVKIVDYDMIEGFIPLTEISKYKINLQKLFKYGKIYPCTVFSYDTNIINLSCIKIKEEIKEKLMEEFNYSTKINEIRDFLTSNKLKCPYFIQPYMYDKYKEKTIEKLFNNILENPEKYFGKDEFELLKTKISFQPSESIYKFKLIVCDEDGITKLKLVLNLFNERLLNYNSESKIECISSPIYSIRSKHINLNENSFKLIFEDFKELILKNNITAIFEEDELIVYKQKKFNINL